MPTSVSVITPVWNRADLTMQFLYQNWGIYAARREVEFVMVDNASTDGTSGVLAGWRNTYGERLRVMHNDKNMGFGPGHNLGASLSRGELLIFLSNDVTPRGDYVTSICRALEDEPGALVGPEMLRHDTGWNTFNGTTIAYLAGWCVACRRETWDKLGGWDERYVPCDYEDIDLSYAAMQAGVPLVQVPLPLSHAFGQSAAQLAGGRLAITLESQRKFKEKWGLA